MMIAVWGNSGSGKSTLAVKLASEFAARQKNTVLIDTDFNAPQVNVWYPLNELKIEDSVSRLIANDINTEKAASKIQVINKKLGVLGYSKDFASASVPKRSDTAAALYAVLSSISDVIVVDCQSSPISDILTFEAGRRADIVLLAFTPDIKALSWYDSNVRMIEESWKNKDSVTVLKAFNKAKDNAPMDEIEAVVGTINYCLPYDNAIADEVLTGDLGTDKYKRTSRRYARIIDTIARDCLACLT